MDKKQILITIIVFLISCGILIIGSNPNAISSKLLVLNLQQTTPKQLYHVYLEGKSIGIIESKEELENYIDARQEKLKTKLLNQQAKIFWI